MENEKKINETLGLENLIVDKIERFYDFQPPDKDKISLIIDKTNGLKQKTKLKFKIFSTNPYPV